MVNEGGFRVNHILKGAREAETSTSNASSQNMKSMTVVNRAQLTPLKNEPKEKLKSEMNF